MHLQELNNTYYQNLYHGTSVINALKILKTNSFLGKTNHLIDDRRVFGVSTSRDRNFSNRWSDVLFVLDADKIKHRNKIIPVDFKSHSTHFNVKPRDNAEDFVVGDIQNALDKITQVRISTVGQRSPYFDDLYDLLQQHGIEVILN